jgi:methionyl-tRNA formyltransferase
MPSPLTLVFCGTPAFAVPTLTKLVDSGFSVPLVVTQPDRPRGRGMELALSPVKQRALELGLPLAQPEKIKNNDEFRAQLTALKPDAIIVVGYGRIVPQWMLDLPPLGNLNLHASLLPKYRGAAPIQWAIAHGETVTGVTTMRINAGLDTGDILLQQEFEIGPDETSETISPPLADIGADLMLVTLSGLQAGTLPARPQDDSQATLAPILLKEDGRIDFNLSSHEIYNHLRGFQPWPGAFTTFRGKGLQVRAAKPVKKILPAATIDANQGLVVGCGEGSLELLEVQPEGKKRMPAADFVRGYRPLPGESFGT